MWRPARFLAFVPFERNRLERVRRLALRLAFRLRALDDRILALAEQAPCLVAPVAGIGQTDLRIKPERQQLFLAPEPVFQAPGARAGGRDMQVKATAIGQLVRRRAGLRVAHLGGGQGHRFHPTESQMGVFMRVSYKNNTGTSTLFCAVDSIVEWVPGPPLREAPPR